MFKLRNVLKADKDNFIIGELPVKPNDVSIITLDKLYFSLTSNGPIDFDTYYNYCVYGVQGFEGTHSTSDNLQKVDIDWYRRNRKGLPCVELHAINKVALFGGLLCHIDREDSGFYTFRYLHSNGPFGTLTYSSDNGKWKGTAPGSTCVAVIHQ